jgi:hypothetical protein
MPKYSVTLTRQVVYSRTVEVEADDEDDAIEQAQENVEDEDVLEDWSPGSDEHYGAPEVDLIGS